jgi:hypothetical protein
MDFEAYTEINLFISVYASKFQSMFKGMNINVDLKDVEASIRNVFKQSAKVDLNAYTLESSKTQFSNMISSYLRDNTNLSKGLRAELLKVQSSIESVDKVGLDRLKNKFKEVTTEARSLGQTGDSAFTKLGKNASQFLNYLGSATVVMTGIRAVQGAVSNVTDLDKAMVSLKKVTNETDTAYGNFINKATKDAKYLGSEISTVVNETAEWAKAGYSLSESSNLAKVSTIFRNVGDVDSATAVKDIVTALKSFGLEANNAISIVDKLNEVNEICLLVQRCA